MRRSLCLIGVLASLAAAAACGPTVNVEQERTALLTVDREWSQTTKDPEKFVTYFADGATVYAPGMPMVTGGEALKKMFTEMNKAPGFELTWTPTKAEVSAGGDIGYTTGSYQSQMGGVPEKGKYVTVWRKQADGTWKVTEDIFNADAPPAQPAGAHATVAANTLKWGDPPPGLPAGAKVALVSGNPAEGPYVIRAQMPANYRIAPHFHPTTENVTVLSGTVAVGMGEKFDEAALQDVSTGGFTSIPAEMRHFFMSKTASTIQIHGVGPFGITYLNTADDPRTKKSN
jgi:ketosteroid isomerase-like protein